MKELKNSELFENDKYYIEYTNDSNSRSLAYFTMTWDESDNNETMIIIMRWSYIISKRVRKKSIDYVKCNTRPQYITKSTFDNYVAKSGNMYWMVSEDEELLINSEMI
jgi:hypothetical protein